jgi:hypothetical protein
LTATNLAINLSGRRRVTASRSTTSR